MSELKQFLTWSMCSALILVYPLRPELCKVVGPFDLSTWPHQNITPNPTTTRLTQQSFWWKEKSVRKICKNILIIWGTKGSYLRTQSKFSSVSLYVSKLRAFEISSKLCFENHWQLCCWYFWKGGSIFVNSFMKEHTLDFSDLFGDKLSSVMRYRDCGGVLYSSSNSTLICTIKKFIVLLCRT